MERPREIRMVWEASISPNRRLVTEDDPWPSEFWAENVYPRLPRCVELCYTPVERYDLEYLWIFYSPVALLEYARAGKLFCSRLFSGEDEEVSAVALLLAAGWL